MKRLSRASDLRRLSSPKARTQSALRNLNPGQSCADRNSACFVDVKKCVSYRKHGGSFLASVLKRDCRRKMMIKSAWSQGDGDRSPETSGDAPAARLVVVILTLFPRRPSRD